MTDRGRGPASDRRLSRTSDPRPMADPGALPVRSARSKGGAGGGPGGASEGGRMAAPAGKSSGQR